MCTSRCAESLWLFKNEMHNVCPNKPTSTLNKNQLHLNSKTCLLIHMLYNYACTNYFKNKLYF